MGQVFALAAISPTCPRRRSRRCSTSRYHEGRVLAVKVLALRARRGSDDEHAPGPYEFYLRRHDRIDTWDLVDLGAPDIDRALPARPPARHARRAGRLIRSRGDRRTALYATVALIRAGQRRRRVPDRGAAHRRPARVRAEGGRHVLRTAGDARPGTAARHPRPSRRDDAAPALRMAIEKLDRADRDALARAGPVR